MAVKLFIAAFGLIAILGLYALFVEPFQLRIKEWNVASKSWQGNSELKIVLLADIHAGKPWMTPERIEKIVKQTNNLSPDIILLLGDYVATHPFKISVPPQEGIAPLRNLKAACGVYAIYGNHDFDNRISGWRNALKKTGIPIFENNVLKVKCGDMNFWLAGLQDQIYQHPNIVNTMKKITDNAPILMMMHEPDLLPEIPFRVTLTMAGHTHGGQIRLPWIGPILVPSKYGTRYAYGYIKEKGKEMIVSGGLGMSIVPLRFLTPPEITLIRLKAAS